VVGDDELDVAGQGNVDEGFFLDGLGAVAAEEVVAGDRRLGAVAVEGEGGGNAHGFEEGAGEAGDRLELAGVGGVGLVDGLDEQLGEELGDVEVVQDGGEAAGAAARGGPAFAAGFGEGVLMTRVVEEAEEAVGEGVSAAGLAVGAGVGAGGGHGNLDLSPPFGHPSPRQPRVERAWGGRLDWPSSGGMVPMSSPDRVGPRGGATGG
jgi:hypothetical protein